VNAIKLLEKDHRAVEKLFRQFDRLQRTNAKDSTRREALLHRIVRELSVHAAIEERELYPAVERSMPDGEEMADHALKEHQEVKEILYRIQGKDPGSASARNDFKRLVSCVAGHVREEEGELFPKFAKHVDRRELEELGRRLDRTRASVPTRPHPSAPSRPPMNVVSDAAAAVVDRLRDAMGSVLPSGSDDASATRKRRTRAPKRAGKKTRARKAPTRRTASTAVGARRGAKRAASRKKRTTRAVLKRQSTRKRAGRRQSRGRR
jgi:hemerythrin superfamily protein